MSIEHAAERIAQRDANLPFSYVVTPNVDHINRLFFDRPDLFSVYHGAWLCLCDSRVLRKLASWLSLDLEAVPGSSLIELLFDKFIGKDDPLTIIGGTDEAVSLLRARYGLTNLAHHNPPMGFIKDEAAIEACVDFVTAHPARFVLLAVGSPQQEILAGRIAHSKRATSIGLCVGAAINLLVGIEDRAPLWMREHSLEWLYRLIQNPRRMWHRYLVRGPRIFGLFFQHEVLGAMRRRKAVAEAVKREDLLA